MHVIALAIILSQYAICSSFHPTTFLVLSGFITYKDQINRAYLLRSFYELRMSFEISYRQKLTEYYQRILAVKAVLKLSSKINFFIVLNLVRFALKVGDNKVVFEYQNSRSIRYRSVQMCRIK